MSALDVTPAHEPNLQIGERAVALVVWRLTARNAVRARRAGRSNTQSWRSAIDDSYGERCAWSLLHRRHSPLPGRPNRAGLACDMTTETRAGFAAVWGPRAAALDNILAVGQPPCVLRP
jgi:hypothetical protein